MRLSQRLSALSLTWKALIILIVLINILVLSITLLIDKYRSLLWLFYYSAISNCPVSWIVPLMPQEPILLIYGTFHAAWIVALTSGLATFVVELVNYQILVPVFNLKQLKPFREKRFYQKLESYFNKTPFAVIAFVGFTPVPHLPFRLLAVLTKYNIVKYALASVVGRASFYYLVAMTGTVLELPYWVYIILLIFMAALALITKVIHSRRKQPGKESV